MTRISPKRLEPAFHRQKEIKRGARWLGHLTQRVMCRLHIPDDASLVWLIGDGGERSNFHAVQIRVKDLLRTHCIDWRCVDFGLLVRLMERDSRARLEEAQGG